MRRILIIQTAFIGDVILATSLIEKIHSYYPEAQLDFLVKKGCDPILENNPKLNQVLIWEKNKNKKRNLFKLIKTVRKSKYDAVINCHRFLSTSLVTVFSKAKYTAGFDKSPFSFLYANKVKHTFDGLHETERNQKLIAPITDNKTVNPALYPSEEDYNVVKIYKKEPYVVIAPASLWYTKQFPKNQWVTLVNNINPELKIYFVGAPNDKALADEINTLSEKECINLCGELTLLQSAALMKDARMNYVNDSSPMHLCSAVDAKVNAVYCSTIPKFGFGPLSTYSKVIETPEKLSCRPCGLHGHRSCPEKHFRCAKTINVEQFDLN